MRTKAKLAIRKVAGGRFTRRDVEYHPGRGEVIIGIWRADRWFVRVARGLSSFQRAAARWRMHKLTVKYALNFEFQIDKEVPFACLLRADIDEHTLIFHFDDAMRITLGISDIAVSSRSSELTRTDWGKDTVRLMKA